MNVKVNVYTGSQLLLALCTGSYINPETGQTTVVFFNQRRLFGGENIWKWRAGVIQPRREGRREFIRIKTTLAWACITGVNYKKFCRTGLIEDMGLVMEAGEKAKIRSWRTSYVRLLSL